MNISKTDALAKYAPSLKGAGKASVALTEVWLLEQDRFLTAGTSLLLNKNKVENPYIEFASIQIM